MPFFLFYSIFYYYSVVREGLNGIWRKERLLNLLNMLRL